ncbi:type II secretion system F family protein [Chitinilyticum litopenaei]|uniref:type II secretion system F family protein n=1 Tax=Chitinilyticum litopenaei TaxID=1121276 RepID=UPI00040F16A9|nr:type II secretion system F family protein [Chitinilyticum litopenaei]
MKAYRYRAVDAAGGLQQGELQAPDLVTLERRLAGMGLTLLRACPAAFWRLPGRVAARRDLLTLCYQLEQLLRGGVPLLDALTELQPTLSPALRGIVAALIDDINAGATLSQALGRHPAAFDAVFVNLVGAGETAGRLPDMLASIAGQLQWLDELAAHGQRALLYPAFAGLVVLGVLVFMQLYLLPQLAGFIAAMQSTLPWYTRVLIAGGDFLRAHGAAVLFVLAAMVLLLRWRIRRDRALLLWLHARALKVWLLGPIVHQLLLARLARHLALLYRAGIPVLDCLEILQGLIGNRALAAAVTVIGEDIRAGSGMTAAFARSGFFPPLMLRLLRIGESTGRLDDALLQVAHFHEHDARAAIGRIQALIEPVLTVVLGLLLLWLMAAVLGPVFATLGQLR